jgi:translation initiation factor IF-2
MAKKTEETAPAATTVEPEKAAVAPATRRGPIAAIIAGGIVAGLALFGGGVATGVALPDGNAHGPEFASQQFDGPQRDGDRDGQRDGQRAGQRDGLGSNGQGPNGQGPSGQNGQRPGAPGAQNGQGPVQPGAVAPDTSATN